MKYLVIPFALICGAVIQSLIPAWGGYAAVKAPILLGMVIYFALTRERAAMIATAFAAGVLQDALGLIPLGYSACCFVVAAHLVSRYRDEVFIFRSVTHAVFGALASGAFVLVMSLLLHHPGTGAVGAGWLFYRTAVAMVVGGIAVPLVCRAVEELDRVLGNLEGRTS